MTDKETLLNELNKCSKCGLCAVSCPIFKETLNECDCAKGKITMLQGVLKGNLKMNDKILSYLRKCEGCNLCANSCPAGINIPQVFTDYKLSLPPHQLINLSTSQPLNPLT